MTQTELVHPPLRAPEVESLMAFLDYHRNYLRRKTEGLTQEQLAQTLAPSTMTLGGLLKHMALVEDNWFSVVLMGNPDAEIWQPVDWEGDPDWEWRTAADDSPEQLRTLWDESVALARSSLGEALAADDLGQPATRSWPDGRSPSLRWILCHMIEEYARHNGHADLIRESVDGSTGE